MTSGMEDPTSGLFQDGSIFLVTDAPVEYSVLPKYSKLVTVTSPHAHVRWPSNNSALRRRLVVLHRKAFEVNSARDLRVKRPAFAFQLDRLQRELQQQLAQHCGIDDQQRVWPVHCVVTSSSSCQLKHDQCARTTDEEIDRKHMMRYARGFLVVLPDMESTETMDVVSGDTSSGPQRQTVLPTPLTSLTVGIAKTLDTHDFDIVFELTENIGPGGKWTVSKLAIPRHHFTDSTCGSTETINLVSLTGKELDAFERHHPAFEEQSNNVVFHSINEVSGVLNEAKMLSCGDTRDKINELLKVAAVDGATVDKDHRVQAHPFIVVEGLDATGKSTVVSSLVQHLNACQLYSPPTTIQHLRSIFDSMPSVIRRAYYSLGNYLVGETARLMTSQAAVVLDRYWHSTAAYAIAEESSLPRDKDHWVYKWPQDLFKPTVIILLVINEDERIQRLQTRVSTQGTVQTSEERQLAVDENKRHRILEAYRKMCDPGVIEVSAQGSPDQVLDRVLNVLRNQGVV